MVIYVKYCVILVLLPLQSTEQAVSESVIVSFDKIE